MPASELRPRVGVVKLTSCDGCQLTLLDCEEELLALAAEVLVASGTVREAIKKPDQNPSLKECMEKGVHPYGMQTFEMHLKQLVAGGLLDKEIGRAAMSF